MFSGRRMQREKETITVMIRRYCRDKHAETGELCGQCRELLEYAYLRLEHCPFQENKTTCGKCPVHCYKPGMRDRVREVMRYVGPRLLLSNPILSLMHSIDGLRRKPRRGRKIRGK